MLVCIDNHVPVFDSVELDSEVGTGRGGMLVSIDTVPEISDVGVHGGSGGILVCIDSGGSVETMAEIMSEATERTKSWGLGAGVGVGAGAAKTPLVQHDQKISIRMNRMSSILSVVVVVVR
jgi:hypothetical protein